MLDRVSLFALIAAAGLLLGVMVAGTGTGVAAFWQTSSILLVVGGSILATIASLPPRRFASIRGVVRRAFYDETPAPEAVIGQLVALAVIARREGMLALDEPSRGVSDPFLRQTLQMAVDGMDAATIETVMQSQMQAMDLRHTYGKSLFETMGRFAPVFGMIGTLIGLVVMLGHMSDPKSIGPGMAVALLTTLYGLVIANLLCLPLARKLAGRSSDELMVKTMMLRGVLAIQAGDHPRIVEQKLWAFLPASRHEPLTFDAGRQDGAGQSGVSPADAGESAATQDAASDSAATSASAAQREAA